MSLLERSQKTNNPNLTKGQIKIYNDSIFQKKYSKDEDLSCLHEKIQNIISADKLATFITKNPRRAQAEIRSAAKICFADNKWLAYSEDYKKTLLNNLIDYMFGFGPIENLLDNPEITEVMVNGTKSIYFEKNGVLYKSKQRFAKDDQVRALIDRILGPLGRRIDEASPTVNARLSSGHRVHAIISPLSLDGTILTIRKFSEHVITLKEMEKLDSITKELRKFLTWAVKIKKNIAVSGGTGSGKTTLLNALSCEISHNERIITIEDSAELRFLEHPHVIRLEARPVNSEGTGEVTIRDLVINSLRMRPDRIVVGECRGGEALDMLQAMNTGHDGSLTTLHANSPIEAISRLTTMVRYVAELPVDVIESYIASALDIVVQTTRAVDGNRYISKIIELNFNIHKKQIEVHDVYTRKDNATKGHWKTIPNWIDLCCKYLSINKKEIEKWKSSL